MTITRTIAAALLLAAVACSGSQAQMEIAANPGCAPTAASPPAERRAYGLQGGSVTFYADVLPILEANMEGSRYKCTTCHADLKEPEHIANATKIDSIIDSMRQGRMPRPGDRVPESRIAVFEKWKLQSFKLGDKDGPRNPMPGSSGAAQSSAPATSPTAPSGTSTKTTATPCPPAGG